MPQDACGGAESAVLNDLAKQLPIPPIHPSDCPCAGTVCSEKTGFPGNTDDLQENVPLNREGVMTHDGIFLRNSWYVAAWDHELIDGKKLARTILEQPIVLYRGASGQVVALDDRCCHRAAPLSMGRIEGDDIRCMYHLSLIHISEPTRLGMISYAVFCLKKKKEQI